jgi:hypothetical protein
MSLFVESLTGLFKGVGKLASGVGKGLEDGFEELTYIPANYRHAKRDKLSGRYTVDITKHRWADWDEEIPHKTVTIQFSGGSFKWDIES